MNRNQGGKRIVISTFGSFGDIHPYIAIALELKARGHHSVMATSEVYREKMDVLNLEFHAVRPDLPTFDQPDVLAVLLTDLMEPKKGSENVLKMLLNDVPGTHDDLSKAAQGADLLLTHPLPMVGQIVAETQALPWVSSVLAPASFLSAHDPPVPPQLPLLYELLKRSPALTRFVLRTALRQIDKLLLPVYQLREQLGLSRGASPIASGQHSPQLVLALFSSVMAQRQPDWPANTTITGFPFYDRRDFAGDRTLDPAIQEFLGAGPPPIVFTLGSSAIWVARDFYRASVRAAQAVNQRALLLIGHERNRPAESLPEGIAAFEYAPYGEVLPKACIVVHQGGVGTTGQSLRSGRPQLVVPFAHDQFDNGARVVRRGCGRMIGRAHYNAGSAATHLRALLDNPGYARSAAAVGNQVQHENGAKAAVDAIERVLGFDPPFTNT